MKASERRVYARFAVNWGLDDEDVMAVFTLARRLGYAKSRRLLSKFGYRSCPTERQIKYMVRNVMLTRRYGDEGENYRELVQRRS